jgi:hypothetical protein
MDALTLTCACGITEWCIVETSPRLGIRYICHCDDCQAFAYFTGLAHAILDVNGGTDAYQLPASRLNIISGKDALSCIRMTSGPLLRWYCNHCKTPVANTYGTSKLSFLSLPLSAAPPQARLDALGPSSGHVWTKFGTGDLSAVRQVNIAAMLWRMGSRIIAARITGDFRDNPLFDRKTSRPIAIPRRLAHDERSALDEKVRTGMSA